MPEELNPDSISTRTLADEPGTVDVFDQDLADHVVVDVNGQALGRITRCFVEGGRLVGCDVAIYDNARSLFDVHEDVARLDPADIARVEGDEVRLKQGGAHVLHADRPLPGHAPDDRGSDSFPRKVR